MVSDSGSQCIGAICAKKELGNHQIAVMKLSWLFAAVHVNDYLIKILFHYFLLGLVRFGTSSSLIKKRSRTLHDFYNML